MDYAAQMGRVHGVADFDEDSEHAGLHRVPIGVFAAKIENGFVEGLAVHVVHDEKMEPGDSAGVVDRDDVRMIEAGDRTRLAQVRLGGLGPIDAALDDPERAVVVYKGGRRLADIAAHAAERGRAGGAVVGELLGLTGERTGALSSTTGPATYLATVIIPPGTGS